MSRRYIHQSRSNSLGEIIPEVMAVVTAKDNLQTVDASQKYFKRNYIDAIRQIIPKFYFSDEASISGTHIAFTNQLINSHVIANKNNTLTLKVSALADDTYLSSIGTASGFAHYFYKDTAPAQIEPDDFQRNILFPVNKKLTDFSTSEAFATYVSGTLLPSMPMVYAGHHEADDLATLTASAYANDSSGTYKYLSNNLGWLYFLNREGPTAVAGLPAPFDASTGLTELLTNTVWKGRSVVLEDSLQLYQEYMWRNQPIFNDANPAPVLIPENYVSSVDMSAGTWTSGTQNLDRLKTLVSIVYSPHFLDSPDDKVKDTFTGYFDTSSPNADGVLIQETEEAGPLKRFLDAMSFSLGDRVTEQAEINTLYDIGKCPSEFLDLLGELIGWQFIGGDVDKWRVQLRNAVEIYKMKGTRRSIQYLLDTMFSTGQFNATTSDTLSELWESYVPELMYYALATSSAAFSNFTTYTPELARQFGVTTYDPLDMDTNIKLLVDKIIFDLVREFPDSFYMGGKPFPAPQLLLDGEVYTGPYVITQNTIHSMQGGPETPTQQFWTGYEYTPESEPLELVYDENFTFYYRNRVALVPPYEKRQYYTPTKVSSGLLNRIEYYLSCYGVDKAFAKQVVDYIKSYTTDTLETDSVLNSFLFFTKQKTYAPNYDVVLRDITKERTPDPASLLSMWNGKSSHFIMNFQASDFNWETQRLTATSKYALTKVSKVLDQVIPAHAIPNILVAVCSVADGLSALADNDCREWRPNFTDLYEGSSTVTTGWATCAVDMNALAVDMGISANRFKRFQVDNINETLLSGTTYVAAGAANRNSLRRRNFHNLLPETKMFTRLGRNNPGSIQLSSSYYSSALGYLPLGFIPSTLHYANVNVTQNTNGQQIGELLDYPNFSAVWDICQNLLSPSGFYGYDVSNTFASRAKQNVASSGCSTYGRRGQLPEIMSMMTKAHDFEKYLQASSIVSGYFDANGNINPDWPTTSPLIEPSDFHSWYAECDGNLDVVASIGNYLINKESSDESLNYYEHFTFGRPIHLLYNDYMKLFEGHGTTSNYNLLGIPNMFSHTYGPLIYNSDFDVDGSALQASSYLAASSPIYEVDIAFFGGKGILSVSGMNGKGAYDLGTSAASTAPDLPIQSPEFRNKYLTSAIELVDTSTNTTASYPSHPTFGIFKLSRDDQTKYSYNKYLINNQVVKYHRSDSPDLFPRIRISIDNSDATNKARNFLQPEHEYEITVKAHGLDATNDEYGGLTLGCWIHTMPEEKQAGPLFPKVYSYEPEGMYDECGLNYDTWQGTRVDYLSGTAGTNGIAWVQNNSELQYMNTGTLGSPKGGGEGGSPPVGEDIYDSRCWEPQFVETIIPGGDPQAISNIGPESLQEIKFRFSTKNYGVEPLPPSYIAKYGKLHRLNQKYAIELFIHGGNTNKFVVIEEISIKDTTNYNKAVIRTNYGDAPLSLQDFKAVMRYFKSLSSGLASRDAYNTSAVMEVSGGSRLNYRSNSSMYPTTENATYKQLTEVDINEG